MRYNIQDSKSIIYSEAVDEYGINIAEDHVSMILIEYCPWCGSKLPDSKRDAWFETLEAMGYDRPFDQHIPCEFKSAKWRMRNTTV